ncbi:hypothetical protein KIW84_063850, partial [Lathyrus oleraceus]
NYRKDRRMSSESKAAEYFCKDFEWEQLRSEIESNPSLRHHFDSSSSSSTQSPQSDVQAWKQFHTRHSSGKFFKERRYLLKEFPQLLSSPPNSNPKLLEVGCGNGSTVLPILRYFLFFSQPLFILPHAIDFFIYFVGKTRMLLFMHAIVVTRLLIELRKL